MAPAGYSNNSERLAVSAEFSLSYGGAAGK
jgi:hypothetical protein